MRALIADDHELFRTGVSHLLMREFGGAQVVEACSLHEAVECAERSPSFDLLVVDLNMPGVSGVDSIAALAEICPGARVVILSAAEGRFEVGSALAAGINGYVPKSLTTPEIARALRQIMEGQVYVPACVTKRSGAGSSTPTSLAAVQAGLTERQRNVLNELMAGKTSKEIGRALDIAEGTVKIHLAAIFKLLGAKSRSEAVAKVRMLAA